MGEMSQSSHLSLIVHSSEALIDAFEVQFLSGFHVYTLSKTLIACIGPCSSDFFKVETLLNNAIYKL